MIRDPDKGRLNAARYICLVYARNIFPILCTVPSLGKYHKDATLFPEVDIRTNSAARPTDRG
jgi:hypothetical protein